MKNQTISTLLVIFGLLLFNLLFWQEGLGINLPIFSIFLVAVAYYKNPEPGCKKGFYYSLAGLFITGIMLVWHHTGLSVFMHFISVFMALATLKHTRITTAFEAVIGFLTSYFTGPLAWYKAMKKQESEDKKVALTFSVLKLVVIPLLAFILFFIIYKNANPKFDELTRSFTESIAELFKDFSFVRLVFLLFGFSFISVALCKSYTSIQFVDHNEDLKRTKNREFGKQLKLKIVGAADFKNEYKTGILIFGLLNALLLVVNLIDVNWIWFGFEVPLDFNLKSFVHEGTYLLIFSILLSMGIFLYFFRGNLNFFSGNKWLKLLGNVWIAQNIVLTLSVFIRNYHYISYHGLAGKRVGVIAFLLMTVFGLLTLIYKVNRLKTTAFLLRLNGWFIFFTLISMSVINWDKQMAVYNLGHSNLSEIDVDYYLKLEESVLPYIYKNLDVVDLQMKAHLARPGKDTWLRYTDIGAFSNQLELQLKWYKKDLDETTWPSWNGADAKGKETVEGLNLPVIMESESF